MQTLMAPSPSAARLQLLQPKTLGTLASLLACAALLILWLGAATGLDIWLADLFFDPVTRTFPWRNDWLTEVLGHRVMKILLTGFGLLLVGVCLGEPLLRRRYLSSWWRLRLRLIAACAVLIPLATSLLKRASDSHCPWDLERYGGNFPYFRILDQVPDWIEAGRCLPGGHASTALWLVGIVVLWLPHRPRTAAMAAFGTLLAGGALGWLQQMRGAHFMTHTLWSMWIAAAVVTVLLYLHGRKQMHQQPEPTVPLSLT